MKFKLDEKDFLETHHMAELIDRYQRENYGLQPEYIIVHPATFHKVLMLTNERADEYKYTVMQFTPEAKVTMYGIAFIRSEDVEPDFVIIT